MPLRDVAKDPDGPPVASPRKRACPPATSPMATTCYSGRCFPEWIGVRGRPTSQSPSGAVPWTPRRSAASRNHGPGPDLGIAVAPARVRKNPATSKAVNSSLPRVLVYSSVPMANATTAMAARTAREAASGVNLRTTSPVRQPHAVYCPLILFGNCLRMLEDIES